MRQSNGGFTLVELLLAMAFFSFILLFVSSGFLIINRAYNKGLIIKLVQDEGRHVVEELSREIRTISAVGNTVADPQTCIETGDNRYYWSQRVDTASPDSPKRLLKERGSSCADPIDTTNPEGEDILHERVGVQYMEVRELPSAGRAFYEITIVLSSIATDLIEGAGGVDATCIPSVSSQYCDVVKFSTVVNAR